MHFQSWSSLLDFSDLCPLSPTALVNGEINPAPIPDLLTEEVDLILAEMRREASTGNLNTALDYFEFIIKTIVCMYVCMYML